ncbi:thioesterase family protein [Staphylothermus hellenicus]|uniref:Thioesterase-like protein n=1 Tax=Staphylothermus hellenicus (strain DSM 12710 / JCM 10830 / BK20S6-10-b1 / P8) TaxID=591019 RepID=D7D8E7_STAHD|nr:thioesterase family protein [Staphylothermus hellenicus]ADI32043.1 thioesterase-like protein [Staphylothermus hellenicus DSM 12710]
MSIRAGLRREMDYVVSINDAPRFLLDKGIGVLSTPRMIALMEENSKRLLDRFLGEEYTSVGIHVDVYHKAPAPVGSKVRFISEIIEVKKNKVLFRVKCMLNDIVVGEGIHERAIVSWSKFMDHVKNIMKK